MSDHDDIRVVWVPMNGTDAIEFSTRGGPYALGSIDGMMSTSGVPETRQAPGQYGATLVDIQVGTRTLSMSGAIIGESRSHTWQLRRDLARTMALVPARSVHEVQTGLLRIYRPGDDPVETPAIPQESPQEDVVGPTWVDIDIQFLCPEPSFRALSDSSVELSAGETGFTFPLIHPWSSASGQTEIDAVNDGDIRTPVLIRVYGELTTPRIINVTTGESIEVDQSIASGEFIEINTAFGDKYIQLVASDGSRTDILNAINLDDSDFWWLEPGVNLIRLEADNNVSGTAWVTWRNRWAAI